ncbi:MAG: hypothetical protein LC785_04835 [Acidobacteria bacterium]|nr:hypothetical protein [Acidobacteriota bacterium]MCA1641307.1 hypothetical protein [Acidobacteriota bacterium]
MNAAEGGGAGKAGGSKIVGLMTAVITVVITAVVGPILVHRLTNPPATPSPTATPGAHATPQLYRPIVPDFLSLRISPDHNAREIVRIPKDARGIEKLGEPVVAPDGGTWIHVKYGDAVGYVNFKLLKPQ